MKRNTWVRIRKILVVAALLIFLHFIGLLRPVENILIRWFNSVFIRLYQPATAPGSEAACQDTLAKTNAKLADQTKLAAENLDLADENQKLRQHLNFFESHKNNNYLLARVSEQENFLDTAKYGQNLIINRGEKNGLTPGLVVLDSNGLVAGKVLEVKANSARVCLLTSSACQLAVAILNQNRTIGVSTGDLGLTAKINFVSQSEKINVGDIVTTSGLEKNIPAGLVLGRVSQINNQENEVWQNISVEPQVDFNNLKIVSIILP